MKSFLKPYGAALIFAALSFPAVALAHSGDTLVYNCASGAAHPLHGLDHVAAMLAVGLWASQLGGHARWQLPSVFLGAMAGGATLGAGGIIPLGMDSLIAATVIVLGLLVAVVTRVAPLLGVAIIAVFALLHGAAHGAEIPAGADAGYYGLGFLASTAALQGLGVALGSVGRRAGQSHLRWLGATCAFTGLVLLVG